jgi:ribonuclease BN (tRNA processing enzyme)
VKLTVIGCSPAWPNPSGAHSGYLLEEQGRLLLDCGPGVLARLRSNGLLEIDAIAITHFHLDHWGDLVPWAWLSAAGRGPAQKPVLWLPPGGNAELETFASRWGHSGMWSEAFDVHEYERFVPFTASGFAVEAHPVMHYGFPAFAFRVRGPSGRTVAYSGDTGPCEGLRRVAAGADLFVCEATLGSDGESADPRGHLSAEEALAHADGRVLLTHRPVELDVPAGTLSASDGLVVDV